MSEQESEHQQVFCGNEDHPRPTPAVARLSWPDGPYRPTTACLDDLVRQVADSYAEGHPVRVEPIGPKIVLNVSNGGGEVYAR